jgi:putative oxidoreductase
VPSEYLKKAAEVVVHINLRPVPWFGGKRIVNTANDFTLTILRVILGVVFFAHGAQKMLGWFGGRGFGGTLAFFSHMGIPTTVAALAIVVEFLCGLGLLVGFLGRIAALEILCKMVIAVATLHVRYGFFMNWSGNQEGEGFEYHLLAIALGLAILIKGSGALSVDRFLTKTT